MGELELLGLTKEYGSGEEATVAVDDLDLTVGDGEFVVLVGPSGCGKSTTLRMVAGLEQATSGEVSLDGRDITRAEPMDRDVAMVFQNYALYPHKNAFDNMAFGLRMSTSLPESEIERKVTETADLLEIGDLLDSKPDELSGGQQQRVALGRAIVREPEVFLMDEPLSNLDARLRTQMRTELQDLQRELGVTTLYVTHDQTEAMTMGDRIAVLDGGRLQQCASPLECYHRPENEFVAGFVGSPSMNVLPVTRRDDVLAGPGFEYPFDALSDRIASAVGPGAHLRFGFRPEDVEIDPNGPSGDDRSVAARVNTVEPTGDVTVVSATVGEYAVTASEPGTVEVTRGDTVGLSVPDSAVHLFEESSGRALLERAATG
jgi:multiple sugar transport system ATP-binding protein